MIRMTLKDKVLSHLVTVSRHRSEVLKNCIRSGIPIQGLLHDLSKFSPAEFIVSCVNYQGNRSPNDREREIKGYSEAWMHHKGRNRHHFEYWTDYSSKTRKLEGVDMPLRYLIEMFCDRVAASKIYMGENYTDSSPLEYFERGRAHRLISPKTSHRIEFLLTMLAYEGEKKTFAYIRHLRFRDIERRLTKLIIRFKNSGIYKKSTLSPDIKEKEK